MQPLFDARQLPSPNIERITGLHSDGVYIDNDGYLVNINWWHPPRPCACECLQENPRCEPAPPGHRCPPCINDCPGARVYGPPPSLIAHLMRATSSAIFSNTQEETPPVLFASSRVRPHPGQILTMIDLAIAQRSQHAPRPVLSERTRLDALAKVIAFCRRYAPKPDQRQTVWVCAFADGALTAAVRNHAPGHTPICHTLAIHTHSKDRQRETRRLAVQDPF